MLMKKDNNYYSLDRKEYYDRLIYPKKVSFFNNLFKVQEKVLPVDLPIIFRELNFGATPGMVSGAFGEPRYVAESHGISSFVFFYKEVISNYKILTQIHFLKDEFFYACYSF